MMPDEMPECPGPGRAKLPKAARKLELGINKIIELMNIPENAIN